VGVSSQPIKFSSTASDRTSAGSKVPLEFISRKKDTRALEKNCEYFFPARRTRPKKRDLISIDEEEDQGNTDIKIYPMGCNSMKWKMEEDKMLSSVSSK
jgi:hypothetical protein